jgi:hypothetical protein
MMRDLRPATAVQRPADRQLALIPFQFEANDEVRSGNGLLFFNRRTL